MWKTLQCAGGTPGSGFATYRCFVCCHRNIVHLADVVVQILLRVGEEDELTQVLPGLLGWQSWWWPIDTFWRANLKIKSNRVNTMLCDYCMWFVEGYIILWVKTFLLLVVIRFVMSSPCGSFKPAQYHSLHSGYVNACESQCNVPLNCITNCYSSLCGWCLCWGTASMKPNGTGWGDRSTTNLGHMPPQRQLASTLKTSTIVPLGKALNPSCSGRPSLHFTNVHHVGEGSRIWQTYWLSYQTRNHWVCICGCEQLSGAGSWSAATKPPCLCYPYTAIHRFRVWVSH